MYVCVVDTHYSRRVFALKGSKYVSVLDYANL